MTSAEIEVEILRGEVEQLRNDLAATDRVVAVLQSLTSGRHASDATSKSHRSPPPIQIGSRERMDMLERALDVLDGFAQGMAQDDCYGDCDDDDCDRKCQPCRARDALEAAGEWRLGGSTTTPSRWFSSHTGGASKIEGAMHYRTLNGWDPRETKIHAAWAKYMGRWGADRALGLILTDRQPGASSGLGGIDFSVRDWPTPRDWYVATSVVQWLATAVGSSILQEAGWKYMHYDEDRKAYEAKRDAEEERRAKANAGHGAGVSP